MPSLLLLLLFSFFFIAAAPTAAAAAAAEEEVLTEADVPDMVAQGEEWVNKRMFDEAKVGREGGREGGRGREGAWEAERGCKGEEGVMGAKVGRVADGRLGC